jgi:tetratricopeptide (TPR) repeat protein
VNSFSTPLITLAVALLAAIPTRAHAQEAPAACQTILGAYAQVEELYERGDFEAAAALLQAAAALCPQEPMLQYNLGRTLERRSQQLREAGDTSQARVRVERAIEAYDAFLRVGEGDPQLLARAASRREALAEGLQVQSVVAAPVAEASSAASVSSVEINPVPWVIAGVGLAALGAGIGLGAHALDLNGAADRAPSMQQTLALLPEANDFATAANITMVAGGVIALAGAVWGIVEVLSAPGQSTRAANPFTLHF